MNSIEGKRVLITGGAGFIGSHLVDAVLAQSPEKLVIVDDFFLGDQDNLKEATAHGSRLELVQLDASHLEKMIELAGSNPFDIGFDLATIPLPASLVKPVPSCAMIYQLTLTMCELTRLGHIKTLIHCSSSEAYGSSRYVPMDEKHPYCTETPYAAAKAASSLLVESYFKTFGIDMSIGRPFNNYGPRQNAREYSGVIPRIIHCLMNDRQPVVYGDGLQTRDYVFCKETARGLIALYQNPKSRGQTWNIATGREIPVLKIIEDIAQIMGKKIQPRFEAPRPGDVRRHCACVKKSHEILGLQNETSWEKGIEETVKWYLAHPERFKPTAS